VRIFYYRERGGAEVDVVLERNNILLGVDCLLTADVSEYRQRGMKSFLKRYPQAKWAFVAPVTKGYEIDKKMRVVSWGRWVEGALKVRAWGAFPPPPLLIKIQNHKFLTPSNPKHHIPNYIPRTQVLGQRF
jgi:hypothetical protein